MTTIIRVFDYRVFYSIYRHNNTTFERDVALKPTSNSSTTYVARCFMLSLERHDL